MLRSRFHQFLCCLFLLIALTVAPASAFVAIENETLRLSKPPLGEIVSLLSSPQIRYDVPVGLNDERDKLRWETYPANGANAVIHMSLPDNYALPLGEVMSTLIAPLISLEGATTKVACNGENTSSTRKNDLFGEVCGFYFPRELMRGDKSILYPSNKALHLLHRHRYQLFSAHLEVAGKNVLATVLVENAGFDERMDILIDVHAVEDEINKVSFDIEPLSSVADALQNTGRATLSSIQFESNSAVLLSESTDEIEIIGNIINRDPEKHFSIIGHTDDVGSAEYNHGLSYQRAMAVVNKLVNDFGVNVAQLEAKAYGEMLPADSNLTELGRAKNRRVELAVNK